MSKISNISKSSNVSKISNMSKTSNLSKKRNYVSIVIVSYNSEKYILECLKSLLFQTSHDFEVILVDDGSTDGTCRIVDSFARSLVSTIKKDMVLKVFKRKHSGISQARNFGISVAKGEIISVLDSDDVFFPDAVSGISDYFREHEDVDLVYGDIEVIDTYGKRLYLKRYSSYNDKDLFKKIFLSFQVPFKHSAMSYRKNSIERIGCYDIAFERLVDVELMCRALCCNRSKGKTFRIEHLDRFIVRYRRHKTSVTNSRKVQLRFWFILIDRHFKNIFFRSLLKAHRFLIEYTKSLIQSIFYIIGVFNTKKN